MGFFDRFTKKTSEVTNKPGTSVDTQDESLDWFWSTFLTSEAKFRHQMAPVKRSTKDDSITIGYILQELLNIDKSDIGSMAVLCRGERDGEDEYQHIDQREDILNYKPYEVILRKNAEGEILPRTGLNTILVMSYRPSGYVFGEMDNRKDKSKLGWDNSIIMFLRGFGFMDKTAYMRVSVMIPNFSNPDDFRCSHSKNAPYTTSFVLGHDITNPDARLKRYDEIEKSLNEKIRTGAELTKEEKNVLEGITYSNDLGHDFGYGRWLVAENRFADALMPLMKAYNYLKTAVVTDYDKLHEIFAETCFNIGFCFNEMEQFDRATYFLDLIQGYDNPKYTIEYINSLVNNGDPRALQTVQHYLSEFNDGKRQIDSEEISFFYDFLARRLAYLFIDYKMWDKARNLLEQLKESPACHDFAVGELEYINRVTGKQS